MSSPTGRVGLLRPRKLWQCILILGSALVRCVDIVIIIVVVIIIHDNWSILSFGYPWGRLEGGLECWSRGADTVRTIGPHRSSGQRTSHAAVGGGPSVYLLRGERKTPVGGLHAREMPHLQLLERHVYLSRAHFIVRETESQSEDLCFLRAPMSAMAW